MQIAKAEKNMVDRWNAIKDQYDALLERRTETQTKENTSQGEVMYSPRSVGYENKIFDLGVSQSDIDSYVEAAYRNENDKSVLPFLEADTRLIKEIASDFDITGYYHALRDNDIRHIRNSHGEKTNEKYPVTAQDIELIPFVVENYDKVFFKTNANNMPGLVFVKVMPENVIYYVEAITEEYEGKKLLINKQMVKTGIEDIPNLKNLLSSIEKNRANLNISLI